MPTIRFIRVKTAPEKLGRLCSALQDRFYQGEKILITVPDDAVAKFVDGLLWRQIPTSFLPHCISNEKSDSPIVITTGQKNVNDAKTLFNLCPDAVTELGSFENIFELYDESHSTKRQQSQQRLQHYQAAGLEPSIH